MAKLKLNKIEVKASLRGRRSEPTVILSEKGRVTLNKSAAELLRCQGGGKLSFFQDGDEPKDWFIGVDHEGTLFTKPAKGDSIKINSADLCDNILKSLGLDRDTYKFPISNDPQKFGEMTVYPIFTRKK